MICEYGVDMEECDGNCGSDCPVEIRELDEEFVRLADSQRWEPSEVFSNKHF